jgi:hypothetical protein
MSDPEHVFKDYALKNFFPPFYIFLPIGNQPINFDSGNLISNTFISDSILRIASGAFNYVSIGYGETTAHEEKLLIRNKFRFDKLIGNLDSIEQFTTDEINQKYPLWRKVSSHSKNIQFSESFLASSRFIESKPVIILFINQHESITNLKKFIEKNSSLQYLIFLYGAEFILNNHIHTLGAFHPKLITNENYFYKLFDKIEGLVRVKDVQLMPESFSGDGCLLQFWKEIDAPNRIEEYIKYINSKSVDPWDKFIGYSDESESL